MMRLTIIAAFAVMVCQTATAEVRRYVRFADQNGNQYGLLQDQHVHAIFDTPYRSHAGMSSGAQPKLFAKLPSAVIGPTRRLCCNLTFPALITKVQ